MRKTNLIIVVALLLSILTACTTDNSNSSAGEFSSINEYGEWVGRGDKFVLKESESPENTISCGAYMDNFYYLSADVSNQFLKGYNLQDEYLNVVYSASCDVSTDIAVTKDGIWIVENTLSEDERNNIIRMISFDGTEVQTIDLNSVCKTDSFVDSILCTSNYLYLLCDDKLIVLGTDGTLAFTIEMPDTFRDIVLGNDNQVYVVEADDNGNKISRVDINTQKLAFSFNTTDGTVYGGGASTFLLFEKNDGLYKIETDGKLTPSLIWDECFISLSGTRDIIVLSDDRYLCLLSGSTYILAPAETSEVIQKTKITIASVGTSISLQAALSKYNQMSGEYYIQLIDYTDGGNYTSENATIKLNTEIISGNCPDMIMFTSLSPYSYISKGLIMDLSSLFEEDEEISLDDIVIKTALNSSEGIYFVSSNFALETMVGLHSQFGDRYGWTLSEYLEIESSMSPESETLYNTTKQQFLRQISARYIRTAVDWVNGTCDFSGDEFIEILEASNRVKENPEDINNMKYGYGPVFVAKGELVAAMSWINYVWKLAYEEMAAGTELSFIGWPTPDGSCGSDIYLSNPIGIVSQSPSVDGCWEFIKYWIMNADENASSSLAVYRPALEEMISNAMNDKDIPVTFKKQDAENLYSLLEATENVAIYDASLLSIIEEESVYLFNGKRSAQEVAERIQSRARIYVSEQS